MSERLLEFTREALEASGCLVERREDGALEAVLSREAARVFGAGELVRLVAGSRAGIAGAIPLSFGPETTGRLSSLLGERGRAAEFWTGPLYLKREGLVKRLEERLSADNAAVRIGEPEEGAVSWLRLTYRWTAVSEEKREGIVETVLNERTGARVSDLRPRWNEIPSIGGQPPPVERLPEAVFLLRMRTCLEKQARAQLEPFRASLERRLERDVRRARDYFGGIARDIQRKIQRRRLEGPEREAELSRIRATEGERERKLASLAERYKLSVRLQPVAVERAIAPATLIPLTVVRKDRSRRLVLVWNPILKELEPLPCDACGEPVWSLSACRETVHVLCGKCFVPCPACGKPLCRACRPTGCACG